MKGHVLVVDDEQETCDLLEMALGRHGFKVTSSTNAARALELVAEQDFDVVLTDQTDGVTIGTQTVTGLALSSSVSRTFNWNTTGAAPGAAAGSAPRPPR